MEGLRTFKHFGTDSYFPLSEVQFAFTLTLLAGLSTGIGSLMAFFTPRQNPRHLAALLGFSAGVMIYVSMIEIFPQALAAIETERPTSAANWLTVAGFFGGIGVIALIDRLVPEEINPHEVPQEKAPGTQEVNSSRLMRTGLFTAAAISIHNFPEGFATFVSALQDPKIAIPIAVAIALHNIPEGIAVSVPIYYATGNRSKALWLSFASGLAEPIGAIVGYLVLAPFLTPTLFGVTLAGVAGIMVYISLDELLPTAREYGEHHHAMAGLVGGMALMALSLVLMA